MPADDPSMLQVIHDKVCRIDDLLTGGNEPSKGVIVRLDRAEQTLSTWRKVGWFFLGVVLAPEIIIAAFYFLKG